ncbi:saccharopine dehydrogenase NADP-binding domain-containing protein [Natroniella sulfidigena]|uniref:saccharopine dehydrogenase NADP-binding domain-containing protein n=1 Tax=Natroniella sulfidigena TaxID=723921 RepID=UPI00200AAD52|nr:saccharopine dehydrogenase NADP-binding domain-containing protein [Natroniella sulfidigena]MCK8816985.1 saccharopine dehydrogenase NADP-binding domain-containing protein [Natroniella sulfidigena]
MEKFGFIIHPLEVADVARKFPVCDFLPSHLVESMIKLVPPFEVSKITGVRSELGVEAEGWFVGCPLTSRQILELPTEEVMEKIIAAGIKAQKLGAKIVGLGAFTSIVGDKGIKVAKELDIPVTTGNSYTVATAIEGTKLACDMMGLEMKRSNILVIGATGSIGKACVRLLARNNKYLMLAARREAKLRKLAEKLKIESEVEAIITTNLEELLPQADIVITASSSLDSLIDINLLKSGAVVCDVARPRDVAREINLKRDDVLVIDGGIVEVPGQVNFNFDFGFPANAAYACMAETMILALDKKYENYSLGPDLDLQKTLMISQLATKHGFKLASLRSMEREISLQQVSRMRRIVNST